MCGKSAHGRGKKYGYYEHSWASKKGSTLTKELFKCDPHRVPAKKLEVAVLSGVRKLVEKPEFVRDILERAAKIHGQDGDGQKIRRIQSEVAGYNSNLEALAERLGGGHLTCQSPVT